MQNESSIDVRIYYPRLTREEILQQLRASSQELSKVVNLLEMRLFGSYAKGTNTASSDVDIFIVFEGYDKDEVYSKCWQIIGIPEAEIHLYTRRERDQMKKNHSLFLKEIEATGISV